MLLQHKNTTIAGSSLTADTEFSHSVVFASLDPDHFTVQYRLNGYSSNCRNMHSRLSAIDIQSLQLAADYLTGKIRQLLVSFHLQCLAYAAEDPSLHVEIDLLVQNPDLICLEAYLYNAPAS
jgi:hypothetical protein